MPCLVIQLSNLFSNHPTEHKMASYKYYIIRMHLLPRTLERKQKEWTIIQHMTRANNFPNALIQKLNSQLQVEQG